MSEQAYSRFEEQFRGSQDEIGRRQQVWLALLAPLQSVVDSRNLLDLGCGRGEWLALVAEAGWRPEGVDLDPGMVAIGAGRGLSVRRRDALTELRSRPDNSLAVITAFQVVEHLPFTDLGEIFSEAFRVLAPGGLLVCETPNPESLTVGTCSFHLDPSHNKPLPPDLLIFLARESNFDRCAVIRLNEDPDFDPAAISLQGVVYGVSPDYALVAQKGEPAAYSWPPRLSGGRSLFEAVAAYDSSLHRHFDWLQAEIDRRQTIRQQENMELISALHRHVDWLQADIGRRQDVRQQEIMELVAWNREEALVTQASLEDLVEQTGQLPPALAALTGRVQALEACQHELRTVYASRSWRLTAPLRALLELGRRVRRFLSHWLILAPAGLPRRLVAAIHRRLQVRPGLITLLGRLLSPFPGLKNRLAALVGPVPEAACDDRMDLARPPLADEAGAEGPPLGPEARRIYQQLRDAIQKRQEG